MRCSTTASQLRLADAGCGCGRQRQPMIERTFAERLGRPDQFSGGEVDGQQLRESRTSTRLPTAKRMQAGQGRDVLVEIVLPPIGLTSFSIVGMVGHADTPARIEQRTSAVDGGVVAARRRDTSANLRLPRDATSRDWPHLFFQPGQALCVVGRTVSPA